MKAIDVINKVKQYDEEIRKLRNGLTAITDKSIEKVIVEKLKQLEIEREKFLN